MPFPTLTRIKLAKFSKIVLVQEKISNLGAGLYILLRLQSSPSFKDIPNTDYCFVTYFVTTYLGIMKRHFEYSEARRS